MRGRLDDFMTAERKARGDNPAPGIRKMAREFYRGARGTLILGVAGAARAGKNTVAEHLEDKYFGAGVKQYALANALKIEVYDWLGTLGCYVSQTDAFNSLNLFSIPIPDRSAKITDADKIAWIDLNKSALRHILQVHGMDKREHDEAYWLDRVLEEIAEDGPRIAVISDIRLNNEPGICHVTINVQRYGDSGIDDVRVGQHISETALKGYRFDYVIGAPAGDTTSLKLQAERVFEGILERFRVQ